jgi:hypothetical protein
MRVSNYFVNSFYSAERVPAARPMVKTGSVSESSASRPILSHGAWVSIQLEANLELSSPIMTDRSFRSFFVFLADQLEYVNTAPF